jgi:hypothetical protein
LVQNSQLQLAKTIEKKEDVKTGPHSENDLLVLIMLCYFQVIFLEKGNLFVDILNITKST